MGEKDKEKTPDPELLRKWNEWDERLELYQRIFWKAFPMAALIILLFGIFVALIK